MEIDEAIAILKELTYGLSNGKMRKANELAIESLKKQIPTKPIIEEWCPAKCPMCGAELSESIGDGYYKHFKSKKVCDCGQKLKWN